MKYHKASCRCRVCRKEKAERLGAAAPMSQDTEIQSGRQVLLVRQQTKQKTRKEITKEAVHKWRERQRLEDEKVGIISASEGVVIRTCLACGEPIAEVTKYVGERKEVTLEHVKDLRKKARQLIQNKQDVARRLELEREEIFPGYAEKHESIIKKLAPDLWDVVQNSKSPIAPKLNRS
mgnify:CR=1 FL=1